MRVHRKQCAEQKRLPGKLRDAVQPTAQHKDEQITRLDCDVEGRVALPAEARRVVNAYGNQQNRVPPKNARAYEPVKRSEEGKLCDGDLPPQSRKLFVCAA